jgi:betaine-aldehyde dehydrogenase
MDRAPLRPLVAARQRDRVEGYIARARRRAPDRCRRRRPTRARKRGWYVEPTVFVDVDNSMRIAQEEIFLLFGPVLAVLPYDDEGRRDPHCERVGVRTRRARCVGRPTSNHGLDVARRVRTGTYTVNGFTIGVFFFSRARVRRLQVLGDRSRARSRKGLEA